MSLRFRTLGPDDEAVLATAAPDVFDDPLDPRATREFLEDPRHHVVVALDAGVVVGFASGVHYVHPDKPAPEFWINEIGVAATHQARGIGTGLMKSLLDVARALGCLEAWVATDPDNHPAHRLYAAAAGEPSNAVLFTFRLAEDGKRDSTTS